jgi:TPR repeat protein
MGVLLAVKKFWWKKAPQFFSLVELMRSITKGHQLPLYGMFLLAMLVPSGGFGQIGQSWQERAEAGSPFAQNNLGIMYAQGEGVPENDVEAIKWFRLAAEQGHTGAQYSLGVMYAAGNGVSQSYIIAYAWWNIAAMSGHKNASRNLLVIERRLEPSEIEKAQALSLELSKTIQQKPEEK